MTLTDTAAPPASSADYSDHFVVVDDRLEHCQLLEEVLDEIEVMSPRITAFTDPAAALEAAPRLEPDVVFLDARFPDTHGVDVLGELRRRGVACPVILLTAFGDEYLAARATRAGADGYLSKADLSPERVRRELMRVLTSAQREAPSRQRRAEAEAALAKLTPRELEVVDLIITGLTTDQIADRLGLSPSTVKVHRANLMRKTRANTVGHLARLATVAGRRPAEKHVPALRH